MELLSVAVRDYLGVYVLGFETDGSGPPPCPPELQYYWALKEFSTLPWPGGYDNQPHATMKIVERCLVEERNINNTLERSKKYEQSNVGKRASPTIKDLIGEWSEGFADSESPSGDGL